MRYIKNLLFFLIVWSNGTIYTTEIYSNKQPEVWLTVFIHGIMSIQPHLNIHNIARFMRDDLENTLYLKTVEFMRNDDYFSLNQAMQGLGLQKIDPYNLQPGNATAAIADIYNQVTATVNNSINHYYTFGWSALLSRTARYKDAEKLVDALIHELHGYWQQGIYPKIRLIGYSHGGNVCLNVAAVYRNHPDKTALSIDELILLAAPIQIETDYLVADPIFKKIYNIFSAKDRIQKIDFFSCNRIFSQSYFKNRVNFKVPENLMQIQLKFTRKIKTKHKNAKRFERCFDFKNPGILTGRSPLLRDCSPGHLEFWFFGWSPRHYRPSFIMHPLPCFIVLPYVIHYVQDLEAQLVTPRIVIADIRPEFETMIIKQRNRNHFTKVLPFLSHQHIDQLNSTAHKVMIDSSFEDEYPDHIKDAFVKAEKYYEDNNLQPMGARNRKKQRKKIQKTEKRIMKEARCEQHSQCK